MHKLIRAGTPVYTKYSYAPGPGYTRNLASDKSPVGAAIAKYGKKAAKLVHIDIDKASSTSRVPRTDIIHKLNDWNEARAIDLKPAGVVSVYKVLQTLPKTAPEIEKSSKDIYSVMEKQEREALNRTEEMLRLITSRACFSKAPAAHFSDSLPNGKSKCGYCSWCMTHKAVMRQVPPPVKLNWRAFKAILKEVPDRDDVRFLTCIAFGISGPRATAMKLSKHEIFLSMEDHTFKVSSS